MGEKQKQLNFVPYEGDRRRIINFQVQAINERNKELSSVSGILRTAVKKGLDMMEEEREIQK